MLNTVFLSTKIIKRLCLQSNKKKHKKQGFPVTDFCKRSCLLEKTEQTKPSFPATEPKRPTQRKNGGFAFLSLETRKRNPLKTSRYPPSCASKTNASRLSFCKDHKRFLYSHREKEQSRVEKLVVSAFLEKEHALRAFKFGVRTLQAWNSSVYPPCCVVISSLMFAFCGKSGYSIALQPSQVSRTCASRF